MITKKRSNPNRVDLKIMRLIVSEVAKHYSMEEKDVKTRTRARAIVVPRQLAHYLCRKHTKMSLAEIGMWIGRKDHATVMYSCRTIQNLLDTKDRETYNDLRTVIFRVKGLLSESDGDLEAFDTVVEAMKYKAYLNCDNALEIISKDAVMEGYHKEALISYVESLRTSINLLS